MTEPPVSQPFVMALTVSEADIDAQNHASNVAILSWMNRAAWEHSRALGYDVQQYRDLNGWFVVRRHEIDYHGRAMLGDKVLCYTWPSGLAKATAARRHLVVRPADETVIARGVNVWAYVDAETARPLRIPRELREAFDPRKFV